MKKIILRLLIIVFIVSSCSKDEGLNPLATIVPGQYVRLDITNGYMDYANINNTFFGGKLTTPSKGISKFDLYIRYTNNNGITNSNYVLLKSITTFPTDLQITPAEIATALNIPVLSLNKGDKFRFLGYSYDENGNVCDYNKLSSVLKTQAAMKQAYKFVTGLEIAPLVIPYDNYEL